MRKSMNWVLGIAWILAAVLIGSWVFRDSLLQFSTTLKCYEGIWIALQGVGTPAAVFVAIAYPLWQERSRELDRLIALRNIAHFVERYIVDSLGPTLLKGEGVNWVHSTAYKVCLDELIRHDRSTVTPARLTECFVNMTVKGTVFQRYLPPAEPYRFNQTNHALAVDDFDQVKLIIREMAHDVAEIDRYLRTKGVTFERNLAFR